MASEATTLVLSRGELYFAPFEPGTMVSAGEIYIGNTPEFVTSRKVDTREVFDSFDGQKMPGEGVIVRENHTARFTTDHMDMQNLSLWYGEDNSVLQQNRQVELTETFTVRRGRFYQLGVTPERPIGIRGVESVSVRIGDTTVNPVGNFDVDRMQGRIQILPAAPDIPEMAAITVHYEQRDMNSYVLSSGKREVYGSLRYVGKNTVGPRKTYLYPCVKLTPVGDIDHKSSSWQTVSFEVEAQRRNPKLEYVYIDEIQRVGPTVLEAAIEQAGIPLEMFPFWEDRLDRVTNLRLPSHYA